MNTVNKAHLYGRPEEKVLDIPTSTHPGGLQGLRDLRARRVGPRLAGRLFLPSGPHLAGLQDQHGGRPPLLLTGSSAHAYSAASSLDLGSTPRQALTLHLYVGRGGEPNPSCFCRHHNLLRK